MRRPLRPAPDARRRLVAAALFACVLAAAASATFAAAPPPAPHGYYIATEDSLKFVAGTMDTVLIDAPRITVAEIVRRVGERLAADQATMGDHAWTQVTRVVARRKAGLDADRTEYEIVERLAARHGVDLRRVRLRQVEREYRDGKLKKEKRDDAVESDWQQLSQATSGIPFSLEGGQDYNYTILARDLVGDHLVYKIGFTPRSRFRALPTGTVWIDCSDWVLRRMEGTLTDGAPLPLFIKSIPWFKFRRAQRGAWWLLEDAMAKVELRGFLPGVPDEVEIYLRTRDHEIAGVKYPDDPPVAGSGEARR